MRKLVVIGVIVIQLGLSASADATPRKFFGTTAFDDPTRAEFRRMGRGRVGTYRTNFYWPAVQPLQAWPYGWRRYDRLIGNAAANGIQVLPTIYGSPSWAAKNPKFPPRRAYLDEFEAFTAAAVRRYGPGGDFWTDPLLYRARHPKGRKLPIREWQLWNEVNSPIFWLPRPHARQYRPLLAAANRGIKGVDPRARIVLSGLFGSPEKPGLEINRYLHQLYRAGGRPLFDAVAIHPYRRTPQLAMETVEETRRVMRRHKDGKTPIWITEVGWATSGKRSGLTVPAKRQAQYLRQMFALAARERHRLRISGVIWFSFKDKRRRPWLYRTGLFTGAFKPKPSWKSFVRFTGGRP